MCLINSHLILAFNLLFVTQHIKMYQLLEDSNMKFGWDTKPKCLEIWSQGRFWDFTYFGIFNSLNKLLERFDMKMAFSFQTLYANTLPRFPNFKSSLFLKINFSPICYDVINEIIVSGECDVQFNKNLHQNWAEKTAI